MNGNGCGRKRSWRIPRYIPDIVSRDRVESLAKKIKNLVVRIGDLPAGIHTPTGLSQQ
jgi:hypothetical protein